ncbi:hypothetical protein [Massilia sp. CF038]|uniref:hypothetical protein n=1 Tax=Massilia sp. CF038 TaxID=1881045 RepID=UPI00091DBF92|nr:hypothetical protein [Massilia sp. CF038]SHH05239.1 hypothetical protein SAMN05428948_2524 [Massilia sp. CF038]
MNIRKEFEAVFIAAVVVTSFAAYATAKVPNVQIAQASPAAVADGKMSVVVVKGKRLTAAQKAAAI